MSFAGFLGGAGNTLVAGQDRGYDLMRRRQEQQVDNLKLQALKLQIAQSMQDRQQRAGAAQAFMEGFGGGQGVPRSMPYPGTQQIPGGMPGHGTYAPPQQGMPQAGPPPGAPIPTPGGAPVRQGDFTPSAPPPPAGRRPGMTGAPAAGGGISLAQFVDNIRSKNPNINPLELMDAVSAYAPLLKQEDQAQFREIQLQIQALRAEAALSRAEGGGGNRTLGNELTMTAEKLGIDTTGKSDNQLRKEIAAASQKNQDQKTGRLTAGERRAAAAAKDVDDIVGQIRTIVTANPGSVGVYGRGAGLAGTAAGLTGHDAPEDAAAAARLKPLFAKLEQRLGVMDSAGGAGGTQFAKQWKEVLGERSFWQTPELLMDELDSISNSAKPAYDGRSRTQGDNIDDIDALIRKYSGGGDGG